MEFEFVSFVSFRIQLSQPVPLLIFLKKSLHRSEFVVQVCLSDGVGSGRNSRCILMHLIIFCA